MIMKTNNLGFSTLASHMARLVELKGMSTKTKKSYSELLKKRSVQSILNSSVPISKSISAKCNKDGLDTSSRVKNNRGTISGINTEIELPTTDKRWYTITTDTENGRMKSDSYLDSISHIVDVYEKYFKDKPNPFRDTIDVDCMSMPLTKLSLTS